MKQRIEAFIKENTPLLYQTLKELCHIPAPSHFEQARAEYCKNWLERHGAQGVYIDEALNVLLPINCQGSDRITVYAAHTDTVFPDTEPMPYLDDGEKIFCPGVADDTSSVVMLLLLAKFFTENKLRPKNGLLIVLNSCEEGLGNLKGTRRLFEDFAGRIESFITLDSNLGTMVDSAVGSHRFEITVSTEGGHSFNAFGNRNAIAALSSIVSQIYALEVPKKEGARTTYNVGTIEGGTSVNTIAQSAKMLCEYRSNDKDCLACMQQAFSRIFDRAARQVELTVKTVGQRPCGDIAQEKLDGLKNKLVPIIEQIIGKPLRFSCGSTDCNIPLSLGVAAVCIGTDLHGKTHTRQEWVDKESLKTGLLITLSTCTHLTEMI